MVDHADVEKIGIALSIVQVSGDIPPLEGTFALTGMGSPLLLEGTLGFGMHGIVTKNLHDFLLLNNGCSIYFIFSQLSTSAAHIAL